MKYDIDKARKVLNVVDQGLCYGLGDPKPGRLCVEAAVCFALGLPHDDDPKCVNQVFRGYKISLNDSNISTNKIRAKILRRFAMGQLGSDVLDAKEVYKNLYPKIIDGIFTKALSHRNLLRYKEELLSPTLTQETCEIFFNRGGWADSIRTRFRSMKTTLEIRQNMPVLGWVLGKLAITSSESIIEKNNPLDAITLFSDFDKQVNELAEIGISVLREMNAPGIPVMDELCPL